VGSGSSEAVVKVGLYLYQYEFLSCFVIPVDNGRTDSDRLSVPCVQCKKYVLRIYVLYRTYSGDTRTMRVAGSSGGGGSEGE
jgi:hypothetical protein